MDGALLPVLALTVALQSPQASVEGTVRDALSGTALAGAVVSLQDLDRATSSGEGGRYALVAVPPGPQHLVISALGYADRTVHALVPTSGNLVLDVSLRPVPVALESLLVEPLLPIRGTEEESTSDRADRTVSLAAIRNHPLTAEPDALGAVAGGAVVVDPESPSGVHIRGGASHHTAYTLDGFPVHQPVHAAGLFSAWSPEALSSVSVFFAAPSPELPAALSGVVAGQVREPGARLGAETSLSTTHASATVHGPFARNGAGYVVSVRSGFPGAMAPSRESSYLRGESGDQLVRLRAPALGGELGALVYGSQNELAASAEVEPASGAAASVNRFSWASSSVGATWARAWRALELDARVWRAASRAGAEWGAGSSGRSLRAAREEGAAQVAVRFGPDGERLTVGVRALRMRTDYAAGAPATIARSLGTIFGEYTAHAFSRVETRVGLDVTAAAGNAWASPRARVTWRAADAWSFGVSASRVHQFTQSLASPESVVRHVFPAELAVIAGARAVPVPQSDQVAASASWRPAFGLHVGVEVFARRMRGLALVSPATPDPFSSGEFVVGGATARGLAMEASGASTRFAWIATYLWERLRYSGEDVSFVPAHGSTHLLDAGVIAYPTATASVRIGFSSGWGRRATDVGGAFEWEACNLADLGCEFAGTPGLVGSPGARELPWYGRLDIGVRKHWHVRAGGRETVMGVFAAMTNVLGRENTLVYARPDVGGPATAVPMRPRAPLVIGLDWRY